MRTNYGLSDTYPSIWYTRSGEGFLLYPVDESNTHENWKVCVENLAFIPGF